MPYGNAAGYDGYMGRWSLKLARSFVRFACPEPPEAALDVGCGTGSLLRAMAAEFPDCRLFGLDPSVDYLVFAGTKTGPAIFVAAEVEALPFAQGAFDHCLSLLVLQDIRDQAGALRENLPRHLPRRHRRRLPVGLRSRHADDCRGSSS